ncbi:MAG: hypothetical protein IV100_17315 [Myxococcales bacterium]|nr:hypothetical protein [Myxococcales bacterium]
MHWTSTRLRGGARVALGLACAAVVIGCSDDPTHVTDATPIGEATETSVPSLVGRVWIGAPVRGGRVEVFAYDGLVRGQGFGETITNDDGRFALPMPDYAGRVVLRISGPMAAFLNPASGETEHFGDSDELFATTVLGPSLTGTELQVDVLTTLITTHALSLRDTEGPDRAVNLAVERFAEHVHPDVFDAVEVARGGGAALTWPTPEAAVTLFHMGLLEVWSELRAARPDGAQATFVSFTRALRADLRDGHFDGLENTVAAWSNGPALDVEVTRSRLAQATVRWNQRQDGWTGLTTADLTDADGFCTLVSTDTGPLYPPDAPAPRGPFDPLPPTVSFESPTPADGAAVNAPFTVRALANDPGGLASFTFGDETAAVTGPPGAANVDLLTGSWESQLDVASLPQGPLALTLSATDLSGNVGSATRTLIIDTIPPVISANALPSVVAEATVELEGQVIDPEGSGADRLTVQVDDDAPETLLLSDGRFDLTRELGQGAHTVTLEAHDRAGNAAKVEIEVRVDLEEPLITISAPQEGGLVGPSGFPVMVTVSDDSAVTDVAVRAVGGLWTDAALADGRWTAVVLSPVTDGPFAFDVRAHDEAGHEALVVGTAVRDGTIATLVEWGPASSVHRDGVAWVSGGECVVRAVVLDAGGIAAVSVAGVPAVLTAGAGDTWSAVVATPPLPTALELLVTDGAGNVRSESMLAAQDATPPTCALTPLPNDGWTSVASVVVFGDAADDGAGADAVSVDGGFGTSTGTLAGAAFTATVLVPDGSTQLTARCTDALGNEATSAPIPLRVDRTPPVVKVSPPPGTSLAVNEVTVILDVTEQSGVALVQLRTAGGEWLTSTPAPFAPGLWRVETTLPLPELDGPTPIEWRVVDLAGLESTGTVIYAKDASAPVIATVDVLGGVLGDDGTTFFVRDTYATVRVWTLDAPSAVGGVTVEGQAATWAGGAWQVLVPAGAQRTLGIKAWDLAGNTRDSAIELARDDIGPECLVGALADGGFFRGDVFALAWSANDAGVGGVTARAQLGVLPGPVAAADSPVQVTAIPLGESAVVVVCQDALGNTSTAEAVALHRDEEAPMVSGCTLGDSGAIGDGPVVLRCLVSDVDPVLSLTAMSEAGTATSPGVLAQGTWEATLPPFGPVTADGDVSVTVTAVDRAGNPSETTVWGHLDREPPTLTGLVLPRGFDAGGDLILRVGAHEVTAVIVDTDAAGAEGTGVVDVQFSVLDGPKTTSSEAVMGAIGDWHGGFETVGGQQLAVTMTDRAGNTATALRQLIVDEEPPSCELLRVDVPAPDGSALPLPAHGYTKAELVRLVAMTSDSLAGSATASAFKNGLPVSGGAGLDVGGLAVGATEVRALCVDALGNSAMSDVVVVRRDVEAPAITIWAPKDGGYVGPLGATIVYRLEDDGAIDQHGATAAGATAAVESDGSYYFAYANVPPGASTVPTIVWARDLAGNESSAAVTYLVDATPPSVTSVTIPDAVELSGTWWIHGDSATILVSVADEESGAIEVSVAAKAAALQSGGAPTKAGTYEVTVPIAPGPSTLPITAKGSVGNTMTVDLKVARDDQAPSCVLAGPAVAKAWQKLPAAVTTATGTDDGVGLDRVEFVVDGKVPVLGATLNGSDWQHAWTLTGTSHSIQARCFDALGNVGTSETRIYGLDTTSPTLTSHVPANGSLVKPGPLAWSAVVNDAASGVASVAVTVGGVTTPVTPSGANVAATITIPSGTTTTITTTVTDVAGNTLTHTTTHAIDSVGPKVTTRPTFPSSMWVSGVQVWVRSTAAPVTYTLTDAAGVATVTIEGITASLQKIDATTWKATATVTLKEGVWTTLNLVAKDNLGNEAAHSAVLARADVTAPSCELLEPMNNSWTNKATVYPVVNGGDAGVGGVVATVTGDTLVPGPSAMSTNDGAFFVGKIDVTSDAGVVVMAHCTDALGNNTFSEPVIVHFDDVKPVITLVPTKAGDESLRTIDVGFTPPKEGGNHTTVLFNEQTCGGPSGCPSFTRWAHNFRLPIDSKFEANSTAMIAVSLYDSNDISSSSFSFMRNGIKTCNKSSLIKGYSESGTLSGAPLVLERMTFNAEVPLAESDWPNEVAFVASDLAGNVSTLVVRLTVLVKPSPLVTSVLSATSQPDLEGLKSAGALSAPFSAIPTAGWAAIHGARVAHLEVKNPHDVALPVRFDVAGLKPVRWNLSKTWRTANAGTGGACALSHCGLGECKVEAGTCASVFFGTPAPTLAMDTGVTASWRMGSSLSSTLIPETNGAILLGAGQKAYLSVVSDTGGSCFVLPRETFNGKWEYLAPKSTSSCAVPATERHLAAACTMNLDPCKQIPVDVGVAITQITVEGATNAGTNVAATIPARPVVAVPGAAAPTVQSTAPGIPLDWSWTVTP